MPRARGGHPTAQRARVRGITIVGVVEFGDKRRTLDQSEPTAGVIANGAARKVPDGSRCVFGPWYPTRRGPLIGAYEVGMLDLCDHRRVLDPIQVHAATGFRVGERQKFCGRSAAGRGP